MSTNLTPQIYVACLASYNNGFLHGQWIDATQSEEEIYVRIPLKVNGDSTGT